MENERDGGQAFPTTPHYQRDGNTQHFYAGHYGMTLRDYFAAHIAQGATLGESGRDDDRFARRVYEVADAMLRAREDK